MFQYRSITFEFPQNHQADPVCHLKRSHGPLTCLGHATLISLRCKYFRPFITLSTFQLNLPFLPSDHVISVLAKSGVMVLHGICAKHA